MKQIINISILLTLVIFTWSCSDFLEEDPQDQIFVDNYFESENDAIAAVNSIYAILNSTSQPPTFGGAYHSSYWITAGLASDEMENRFVGVLEYDQLETFKHTPVNGTTYDFWQNAYKGINNANFAIAGIPSVEMDEARKASILGEAYFLRGMLYFDLVRMFGNIPLIINEEAPLFPDKTNAAQIYVQIKDDLTFAANNLVASYDRNDGLGRATSGAAIALLAKVHLTTGEYQECINRCDELISSGRYELWDDYAEAFRIENENGKESIFNIGFGDANGAISFWEVGQFNVRLLPSELSNKIPGINAQGWQVATQDLFDSFVQGDRRKSVTLMDEIVLSDGSVIDIEPHIRKYWDEESEPKGGNTENDFPYLRYSDIFLMKAEAINELNDGPTQEAYDAINKIRKRARWNGGEELDILPDLSGMTYQEFKNALLRERRWEFSGEGHRWFDLVRFDALVEAVEEAKDDAMPQPFHDLFPIPQEELDLNDNLLPQNPGY